jgi:hypothetical protein
MTLRPASVVEKMLPIRGHLVNGLKGDVQVRVYGNQAGCGSIEIDGRSFPFTSRAEALRLLDEYLSAAMQRASGPML